MTYQNKPKVSVVMPIFNHSEEQLTTAIDSILKQTFEDFELIIIDGNVHDKNFHIISKIKDDRIKYYKQKGYINCLNFGIEKALGSYIARMDSDDISYSTRLEEQVKFLDSNPEVSLCSCLVKFNGEKINLEISEHNFEINLLNFINSPEFVHTAMMFRKNINLKYENLKPLEDCLLFRKLLLEGHKFAIIDKVLMNSYISQTSLMKKYPKYMTHQLSKINIYALARYFDCKFFYLDDIFKKKTFSKDEIIEFLDFLYNIEKLTKQQGINMLKIAYPYYSYILSKHKNNTFLFKEPLFYKTYFKPVIKKCWKNFIENIFSITNEYNGYKCKENKIKIITFLGLKYKFRPNK